MSFARRQNGDVTGRSQFVAYALLLEWIATIPRNPPNQKARQGNAATEALVQRANEAESQLKAQQSDVPEQSSSLLGRTPSSHGLVSEAREGLSNSPQGGHTSETIHSEQDGFNQPGGDTPDPLTSPQLATPRNDLLFTAGVSNPHLQTAVQPLPVVSPLQFQSGPSLNYGFQNSPPVEEGAHITIPAGHHTTTSSLLSLQPIRRLVGYYPQSLFYDLETSKAFPDDNMLSQDISLLLSELDLDQETTARLISNFFSFIHTKFPIVDPASFPEVFDKAIEDIARSVYQPSLAVCLLVLALGALGSTEDVFSPENEGDPSSPYFAVAYRILMIKWAGSPTTSSYDVKKSDIDSLSEFHLPRSGIEIAIDRMYFPRLGGHSNRDALMFLALCSIRRLLNRIHNAVYTLGNKDALSPPESSSPLASSSDAQQQAFLVLMSLEGIFNELERQLDAWYGSLPEVIKPDLSNPVPSDTQDAWLRLRYCLPPPEFVYRYSQMCIDSSHNYIRTGIHTLDKRTYYSWMTFQALRHLVPDINDLLRVTVDAIKPWAAPDSSAEVVFLILRTLYHKMRFRSPSPEPQL
ncbi:hypothetical protein J7T55_013829 [Diaporthe amygdali]|uniref:uncharacterized protein n=1 Tax=Phomopsis amygdali TaxID=1214568 RepID=UPI0022FED1C3|nr:uncharacterized protein J7T55_013829 [Diaporthe amygdali]KAJ0119626.1 hypothetical protein J7T55_013829 [Diaporthe amygdali]